MLIAHGMTGVILTKSIIMFEKMLIAYGMAGGVISTIEQKT